VTAGPIFGRKTYPAGGEAAEREASVLADRGMSQKTFEGFGKLMMGTRRHNVIYPDDFDATAEAGGVRCTFTLPAGSYATVLLRELMHGESEWSGPEA
jgi:tRNA pseudouridine13 synthase